MGDVNDFPEVEMVNQNVFDDRFCETLASECPFLTHFVIQEVGEYFNRKYLKPISTFTDRGLMALTQLKYLRFLQLRSINCTGKGIFEFLNAQSSELTGNRSFEVTVGGCPEDSTLAFYEVVKELLAQLADTSDLPCARQKFALRIENWSYNSRYSVDPAWSETYLSDLEKLMNRVKDAHPSLRQHVWEDWEQERENKDITIVDREDMLPDDRGFDDASDFDDYDDAYLDDDIYDGEGESDIDSEYLEDDSDFEINRFQACKQLFDNVVKFCPGVEYLGGYKKALNEMEKLTCRDGWLVMVEQWEEFNATCTQLREFHWVVAPFADSFFRVFGEHVKPRLKKLTFAENMLWEWGVYFDSLDEAAGIPPPYHNFSQRPEYGFKATDVSSALKGCPALDDLEIELYHPADEDETEYNDPYNAGTVDFPEHEVLNIDIYDDKFCETLVKHCPLLTKFSIWEVAEGHNSNLTPIRAFTDQGLVALAKLKYLTALELRTINCTGNGVFEFLNELSDEFVGHRTFQICVGGHPSDSRLAFYNAVPELLMQLEAISPEELGWGRRKFVLRLRNSNFGSVEPGWSEQYLRGLEHVVNNVKKMHPNLRLRITTSGRRGSTFRSIIDLGLYTSNVEPSLWYGWDDEESDRNITFVNRGGGSSIFDQGRNRLPRTISTITD
ncbi:hypothetical protein PI124_g3054 [Phytophthora idaei]|nr:hypothetical protein PI124_g3054 [Phytophthora idaei]